MKWSASTPRVTRSPFPQRGQVIVMNGEQFEDGRQRIVVGYDVTLEDAQELGRILDARDAAEERLTVYIEKISAVMEAATRPSVQEPERMNLAPLTVDDLLRIANRPGGLNDQLRAAMDARDHADGGL